jgi:poly(3-hydroxyalkanoate) depolymerase
MSANASSPALDDVERTEIVRVGGATLRVRVRDGGGIPLVLCNGIGGSLEVLQPLIDHLRPDRPVVRFDVPGTGGSPTPALPYGFPFLAWVLGRALDQLGYSRADVLGFSWGGALAQQFAFQNPRRCRRLVLAATATGAVMVPACPLILIKIASPRRFRDPDYLASIAAEIYGGTVDLGTAAVTALGHHMRPVSWRGYLYQLLAGSVWTSLFALPAIRQPTLLIAGTDDPIIPTANAHLMHALLPHPQLYLHDGGHIDLITRADTIGPVIDSFLDHEVSPP